MSLVKKIGLYKLLNLVLFFVLFASLFYLYINYSSWCVGKDVYCNYKFYAAIYEPLLQGGKILLLILGGLIFVPTPIFRRWLFFVASWVLLLVSYLVTSISVFSSGVMSISRAQMAQNGMYFLGVVTIIFVAGHLLYDWRKKKTNKV